MKLPLRFACPSCGHQFPFFTGSSSSRVRSGPLSAPWFRCPECEALSRQTVAWVHALWAWPLALFVAVSIVALFRNASPLIQLHRSHPGVYGALAGLSMASVFLLIRFALRLTPVPDASGAELRVKRKSWLAVLLLVALLLVLGFATRRWLSCAIGLVIGIAVWIPFYLSAKPREQGSVEPNRIGASRS